MSEDLEKLKYPIGKFHRPKEFHTAEVKGWIDTIKGFPIQVKKATAGLSDEQLDWKYRPDGWSVRQLVHHCADSHMNSFIRFKLTLTEDLPTIKPYHEDLWAKMPDYLDMPIEPSISILEGLHERWVKLLSGLSEQDLDRKFVHPEHGREVTLGVNISLYAWHCAHHLAHIRQALDSKGKYN